MLRDKICSMRDTEEQAFLDGLKKGDQNTPPLPPNLRFSPALKDRTNTQNTGVSPSRFSASQEGLSLVDKIFASLSRNASALFGPEHQLYDALRQQEIENALLTARGEHLGTPTKSPAP